MASATCPRDALGGGDMTVLQRDGVRLAYVAEGKGEPAFVFMHGWTCNRSYFKPQHDHFKAKHRVVSVDLRGHGESDKPKGLTGPVRHTYSSARKSSSRRGHHARVLAQQPSKA